jgi:hypothetical protein
MISVKEKFLFNEVLKELNYSFGNIYIFEKFVVSEINEGVHFNWENHGKVIVDDVTFYLGNNGDNINYISNRIHSYSVVASDWLKFFKHSYSLKSYLIVSNDKIGLLNSMIENLFFKSKIKRFESIEAASNWIKNDLVDIT